VENKKSYYAIIPAGVRYCKDLKPNAKLLYGEITALTNEKGYCWASNEYFAVLYEVKAETISRWISQLKKLGFINVEYKREGKNVVERKIYIQDLLTKKARPLDKIVKTPCQKDQEPLDKIVKDNTTINNTYNTTYIKKEPPAPAKKTDTNYNYRKNQYFTFLIKQGYQKRKVESAIFESKKERQQLANLLKSLLLPTNEDLTEFLNWCRNETWCVKNNYMPSIIVGQIPKWKAGQGLTKNTGVIKNDYASDSKLPVHRF